MYFNLQSIENIHLTLKFLGEVDESKIKTISEELKKTVREHTSFESCIGKLGTFPTLLNPKIIWIGIRKNEDKINKLQQAIEKIMEPLGLKKETRAFSSHLTLGRVRSKKNIQKLTEKIKILSLPQFKPITVDRIVLFQSILKSSGAEYNILDEFNLKVVRHSHH